MVSCKHSAWIQVTSGKEVALLDPNRLSQLIEVLPEPCSQRPSLVSFVGRQEKNLALKRMFPLNHPQRYSTNGVALLHVDRGSLHSKHPILFAESYPTVMPFAPANAVSCHETKRHPLPWAEGLAAIDLYNILHSHLLYPFVDAFCIFADDFSSFSCVIGLLQG